MSEPRKYRKKPVVIDAVRCSEVLHKAQRDWYALPDWIIAAYGGKNEAGVRSLVFTNEGVHITTLEGTMLAEPTDWIIRGVKGEFYPCKPDIFAATYDSA
jgi:hypothetical protein